MRLQLGFNIVTWLPWLSLVRR